VKVFVLTSAFDYEGESPIGVYASLQLAQSAAEKLASERGYGATEWSSKDGFWQLPFGSTQWNIREEEVVGGENLVPMCESLEKYGRCGA